MRQKTRRTPHDRLRQHLAESAVLRAGFAIRWRKASPRGVRRAPQGAARLRDESGPKAGLEDGHQLGGREALGPGPASFLNPYLAHFASSLVGLHLLLSPSARMSLHKIANTGYLSLDISRHWKCRTLGDRRESVSEGQNGRAEIHRASSTAAQQRLERRQSG